MNDLSLETKLASRQENVARKRRSVVSLIVFISVWAVLIGGGFYMAKWYTDKMQQEITTDIERQTSAQLKEMQTAYNAQLTDLETNYAAEMTALKGKIDALNELLTFTKDNADTKTDNSNKLYTQLNEVKKQLDELKKSLDVLK
jgi:chromosome segregation ATPase